MNAADCPAGVRPHYRPLGRILRIFFRPGRPNLGDRLQPLWDHPKGRARVDEEGLRKSALSAACVSGKIVKIAVSNPADCGVNPKDRNNSPGFIQSELNFNAG